jgi:hypothetical protein
MAGYLLIKLRREVLAKYGGYVAMMQRMNGKLIVTIVQVSIKLAALYALIPLESSKEYR